MIKEISYFRSSSFNPYENLSIEEYLLEDCREDECIIYLWQNKKTVVIGKNQNAWKECQAENLEKDGGHVVRRLSGGGAVYHDTGNLNFTFLVRKENYDLDKQLQVIINAVNSLGIKAVKSGRNDILADGRKFSGNAFYKKGDHYYHHGTLMVDVDTGALSRYLTVSDAKLKSKGVDSVKSRVTNLKALNPEITIESLAESLVEAFQQVYGLKAGERTLEGMSQDLLQSKIDRFSSWEWIYGRKIDFQYELTGKTEAGEVTLQLQVNSGIIEDLVVYSDSLDDKASEKIAELLRGTKYSADVIDKALAALGEAKW
ncbi:MAG: lipoate--protein ligase [Firmicutes bacterium]|nr:lipoate--protein ligase [Bacillota bacterium]